MQAPFSHTQDQQVSRAYTHVSHGEARVGNRWLERVWSVFMGRTTSLIQKAGEIEWVARRNPEFSLTVAGKTLESGELGEIEWSEECNNLGATLVAIHRHASIEVRVEQLALHDVPALLRTVTLRNPAPLEVEVDRVVTESIAMDSPDTRFSTGDLSGAAESAEYAGKDAVGALLLDGTGLLFLNSGAGGIDLGSAEVGVCSASEARKLILAPMQQVSLGRTMILAFEGEAKIAHKTLIRDVEGRIRLHDRVEDSRRREDP